MNGVTAAVVTKEPLLTESIHMLCRATVDQSGAVTVTCVEDGRVMATYRPGTWRQADNVDRHGAVLETLSPPVPAPAAPPTRYLLQYRVHATGQEQAQQFESATARALWLIGYGAHVEVIRSWEEAA